MIYNYLKIFIRAFRRNKMISVINLIGLSIGIAVFAVIVFYVDYELNYDRFQPNHSRIYRAILSDEYVGTPAPFGKIISLIYPEVESVTRVGRISWGEKVTVRANEHYYYENRFYLADTSFFETFDYELLLGNRSSVLNKPFSVVISEKTAKKYFNRVDVIGETIEYNNHTFQITGIAKDVPHNSHFHFDLLAPFLGLTEDIMYANDFKYWGMWNFFTYIKFKKNTDIKTFKKTFKSKIIQYVEAEYGEYGTRAKEAFENFLRLEPIKKAHVEMRRGNLEPPINKKVLMIYIFIAIIVLVVASINYINLSIVASLKRAKEFGLRKVVGAVGGKIRIQFLSESILFTVISLIFSYFFIELFIPLFQKWFDIYIVVDYLDLKWILLSLFIIFWAGIISGSYPAFFISAIQPIKVLKSGFKGSKVNTLFRNVLMVVQFVISVCLIVSAFTVSNQLKYVENLNLGYNRHSVANIILHDNNLRSNYKFLKQAYSSNANILTISANSFDVTKSPFHQGVHYEQGNTFEVKQVWLMYVDEDFLKNYEITLLQGTTFPSGSVSNSQYYVINKLAAESFFGSENPIGKRLSMSGKDNMGQVVGVIDNFNFRSLHHPVEPIVFSLNQGGYSFLSMRINPMKYNATIVDIENKWKELYPNYPFEIRNVDSEFNKLYNTENQTGSLILVFAILSIFISCMGLFGINHLVVKYRVREISVRKVFGASLFQIIMVLSKKIVILVVVSNLIAWPIVFFIMDNWLNNFTYRINLQWFVFILAGLITLFIALLTISSQSIKTANTNPAKTLKFE